MMVTDFLPDFMNQNNATRDALPAGRRPPHRVPALQHRHPGPDELPSGPSTFQGVTPREIPFELPRLIDANGDFIDDPDDNKIRRRRFRPPKKKNALTVDVINSVRLGQMAGRKNPFSVDGLDISPDSDDFENRLRDNLDGESGTSRQEFNSRGSTPLCMVQVVGVGLSQSLPSLDITMKNPEDSARRNPMSFSNDSPRDPDLKLQRSHAMNLTFIGTNQERLQAEIDYMESMRTARRKREVVPHREPINLAMGGRQVMFFERMDIMGEIQKLKTIALPVRAKELFVGRGFRLPPNHALNNPRKPREITSSDGKPVGKRRGSRFNCDYASFNAPTTQSVPEFNGNTTDSDSLVMVGDSLSQGKSQGFKIYQGSRKGPRLLDLAKSQEPSSNRSNYALNAKQSDLNINDY